MTCLKHDAADPPSPVIIVLEGLSKTSGKAIPPSEKVYLNPSLEVRSIFFAPFSYSHLAMSSSRMKNSSGTRVSSMTLPPSVIMEPSYTVSESTEYT